MPSSARSLAGRQPRAPCRARRARWKLIEQAGALEPLGVSRRSLKREPSGLAIRRQKLWISAPVSLEDARRLVMRTTLPWQHPGPLRWRTLIAGGITTGKNAAPDRYGRRWPTIGRRARVPRHMISRLHGPQNARDCFQHLVDRVGAWSAVGSLASSSLFAGIALSGTAVRPDDEGLRLAWTAPAGCPSGDDVRSAAARRRPRKDGTERSYERRRGTGRHEQLAREAKRICGQRRGAGDRGTDVRGVADATAVVLALALVPPTTLGRRHRSHQARGAEARARAREVASVTGVSPRRHGRRGAGNVGVCRSSARRRREPGVDAGAASHRKPTGSSSGQTLRDRWLACGSR